MYARIVLKAALGSDDIVMLVAAVLATAFGLVVGVNTLYGLGSHMWNVQAERITIYYEVQYSLPKKLAP